MHYVDHFYYGHKMQGPSRIAEELLASQQKLSYTELVGVGLTRHRITVFYAILKLTNLRKLLPKSETDIFN
jgi:hypothetical protein